MYLDAPVLPVSFSVEEAVGLIESLIKSRYWGDFRVGSLKLIYLPYWFFSYSACEETEGKKGRETKEVSSGRAAISGITGVPDEAAAAAFPAGKSLLKKADTSYPFEVLKSVFSFPEAKETAAVKIASSISQAKENVIISGLEKAYIPVWSVSAEVGGKSYRMEISAVSGEIIGEEEIREREKGWLEITSETIEELKSPGAWVEYSKQIGESLVPKAKSFAGSLLGDKETQVIVLAVIAIIVVLWAMLG
jgi:hypothetical protein